MDPLALTALIDPAQSIDAVVARFERHMGARLFAVADDDARPVDPQALAQLSSGPRSSLPSRVGRSGDAEICDRAYGLVLAHDPPRFVHRFQEALLPSQEVAAPAALRWRAVPPVALHCARDVSCAQPYFAVRVELSLGVFGVRHLALAALARCLRDDLRAQGPSPSMSALASEAERAQATVRPFEVDASLAAAGEAIWQAARCALGSTASPIEAPIGLAALEADAWMQRLGWYGFERARAIRFLGARRDAPPWPAIARSCMAGRKHTWPAVVEIWARPPVSDAGLDALLTFLADPNWPGFDRAWAAVAELGARALPHLDAGIARAKACGDGDWAENLASIRDAIAAR